MAERIFRVALLKRMAACAALLAVCAGCSPRLSVEANETSAVNVLANLSPVDRILVNGLDERNPALRPMERLLGVHIAQSILNRTIVADRTGMSGPPSPLGETFREDWTVTVELASGPKVGRYAFRAEALCIDIEAPPGPSCRAVYRDASGRLYQVFYGGDGTPIPILIR